MLHGIINRLALGDVFFNRAFEPRKRNFAKLAWLRDVTVEPSKCFLNALSREIPGRVIFHDATENAIGVNRDASRRTAADRVLGPGKPRSHQQTREANRKRQKLKRAARASVASA